MTGTVTYLVWRQSEGLCNVLKDSLHDKLALGTAEATERGVRWEVGTTELCMHMEVGNLVAVVHEHEKHFNKLKIKIVKCSHC